MTFKFRFKEHHYYIKEILAFLFLLLAIHFFRQQGPEIARSAHVLKGALPLYILFGIGLTGVYILLNGLMYVYSFKAVDSKVALYDALKLFLKRNLISVFLPGGGVTSLAFFTADIGRKGVSKTRIGFASYIFAVIGIISLAVVAVPVLFYVAVMHTVSLGAWGALAGLLLVLALLFAVTHSFVKKGFIYRKLVKVSPQLELFAENMQSSMFAPKEIIKVLLCSIFVEITGILHLFIAMKALGLAADIESCIAGYIIATLFYAISPFLRGLGAVEVTLVYVLTSYGMDYTEAISVTVLYRVFEFWLPLAAGIGAFLFNPGNILLRLLPALLLGLLGIVNIISVLTPPMADRIQILENFIPASIMHLSNLAVVVTGVVLLVCAAFLIRGFRNAWKLAILLSVLSFIGNISKAIDYEEATLAFFTLVVLLATRKQYRIKGDSRVESFGVKTAASILGAVLVYGIIGFYFLDKKEFGIDFTFVNSVENTLYSFLMLDTDVQPLTRFAKGFLHSINLLGFVALALLVYTLVKPYIFRPKTVDEERDEALGFLRRFAKTADDHFKAYRDKSFYFGKEAAGFIAYKTASGFAIALGEPVCEDNDAIITKLLTEFEDFCRSNGVKPVYYKIDESRLPFYKNLGKKAFPIGQEALVDLEVFSLEGKDRKSMRNAVNAVEKKGIRTVIYEPPLKDGLLQKLKQVSDDWLRSMERCEIVFSSGMFLWDDIKQQEVIALENADEKIVAFLNIIPDYAPGEGTYDLIRKTEDAPAGVMDTLIVALARHLKEKGLRRLNMGVAPMSGIDKPKDFTEWTVKFAYDRLRQFRHYHGLRDFKDKFSPEWGNKYLIYENHYDLVTLPSALKKVMRDG